MKESKGQFLYRVISIAYLNSPSGELQQTEIVYLSFTRERTRNNTKNGIKTNPIEMV
jgi:hypothetical protein